jgi:hypothetical protein
MADITSILIRISFNGGQWRTQKFFFGGRVQQIQLRIEGRGSRDLGAVAP